MCVCLCYDFVFRFLLAVVRLCWFVLRFWAKSFNPYPLVFNRFRFSMEVAGLGIARPLFQSFMAFEAMRGFMVYTGLI